MSVLDTMAERRQRALVVADVRAFDPAARIGNARLEIRSGWKQHDDRWMEWSFGDVRVEGYFHSAHGAHAEGWRRWLHSRMTEAQAQAYEDGDDAGWQHRHRKT